jgi:WD40 repeat protein
MAIAFKCPCGNLFKVGDEYAGKRTTCPACGAKLKVPTPRSTPQAEKPAVESAPDLSSLGSELDALPSGTDPLLGGADPLGLSSAPDLGSLANLTGLALPSSQAELCPQCQALLTAYSVVCMRCGFDKRPPPRRKSRQQRDYRIPIAIGGGAVGMVAVVVVVLALLGSRGSRPRAENPQEVESLETVPGPPSVETQADKPDVTAARQPRFVLPVSGGFVSAMAFDSSGARFAAVVNRRKAIVWDLARREELATFQQSNIERIAFTQDGNAIAMFGDHASIWDIATRKTVSQRPDPVADVFLLPDGENAISLDRSKSWAVVQVWHLPTGQRWGASKAGPAAGFHPAPGEHMSSGRFMIGVTHVDCTSDGKVLSVAGLFPHKQPNNDIKQEPAITFWDLTNGDRVKSLIPIHVSQSRPVGAEFDLSPDGSLVATVNDADRTLVLYDTEKGEKLSAFPGSVACRFSPNGAILALLGAEQVKLWDVEQRRVLDEWSCAAGDCVFAPGGETCVTLESSGRISFWDIAKPQGAAATRDSAARPSYAARLVPIGRGDANPVFGLAYSRDGKLALQLDPKVGSQEGELRIVDTATGDRLVKSPWKGDWVPIPAFSPDGSLIALGLAASDKGLIALYDAKTLTPLARSPEIEWTLEKDARANSTGGIFRILQVLFSDDGKTLYALERIGVDRSDIIRYAARLRRWDVATMAASTPQTLPNYPVAVTSNGVYWVDSSGPSTRRTNSRLMFSKHGVDLRGELITELPQYDSTRYLPPLTISPDNRTLCFSAHYKPTYGSYHLLIDAKTGAWLAVHPAGSDGDEHLKPVFAADGMSLMMYAKQVAATRTTVLTPYTKPWPRLVPPLR